jgi:hypothetical protein
MPRTLFERSRGSVFSECGDMGEPAVRAHLSVGAEFSHNELVHVHEWLNLIDGRRRDRLEQQELIDAERAASLAERQVAAAEASAAAARSSARRAGWAVVVSVLLLAAAVFKDLILPRLH